MIRAVHTACFTAATTPASAAAFIGGQVYWQLGYPEKGLAFGRTALALAERIAHPFSLASARANLFVTPFYVLNIMH
jgi:hypothetical protein